MRGSERRMGLRQGPQDSGIAPDPGYWVGIYRENYEGLRRYFARYVKCPHDVEDLVQGVFLRLIAYNCSPQHPHTYVRTVARHQLFTYLRRRKKNLVIGVTWLKDGSGCDENAPCSDRDSDPLEQLSEKEMAGIVVSTLDCLSPILAEALRLRFMSGLHLDEAASRAGCSCETLKKRLKRAKRSLIESWDCGEGLHDG